MRFPERILALCTVTGFFQNDASKEVRTSGRGQSKMCNFVSVKSKAVGGVPVCDSCDIFARLQTSAGVVFSRWILALSTVCDFAPNSL